MASATSGCHTVIPLQQRKRHETWWLHDGSIVLATPTVLFCVHQSALSRHSPFFRTLFSLPPPPPSEAQSFDGIPVIDVYDDPNELAIFLQAVHDPFYYYNERKTEYSVVVALLRLSSKYEVDELRRQTIKHLRHLYPDNFDAFESFLENHYSAARDDVLIVNENDVSTFLVAHETGLLRMLPVTCFWIAINLHEKLISEMDLPDGCVTWIRAGIDSLRRASSAVIWKSLFGPRPLMCMTRADNRCGQNISSFLFHGCWDLIKENPNVFRPYPWDVMRHVLFPTICEICRDDIKNCMLRGRREVWEALPTYFGLGDWKTLKDSDVV